MQTNIKNTKKYNRKYDSKNHFCIILNELNLYLNYLYKIYTIHFVPLAWIQGGSCVLKILMKKNLNKF